MVSCVSGAAASATPARVALCLTASMPVDRTVPKLIVWHIKKRSQLCAILDLEARLESSAGCRRIPSLEQKYLGKLRSTWGTANRPLRRPRRAALAAAASSRALAPAAHHKLRPR
jgi:hypothetical protein